MSEIIYRVLWVCTCCLMAHAADGCGECDHDDREPLNKIEPPFTVTLGMLASEHHEQCPRSDSRDCDCERLGFSWSSCDGCGSPLGGDRHAMTLWGPPIN